MWDTKGPGHGLRIFMSLHQTEGTGLSPLLDFPSLRLLCTHARCLGFSGHMKTLPVILSQFQLVISPERYKFFSVVMYGCELDYKEG